MIDKRELSEEDIKNRFITPAIEDAGWDKTFYFMERNVNLTVEAVARGQKRILLVMATGTGKTYTAFQTSPKRSSPSSRRSEARSDG